MKDLVEMFDQAESDRQVEDHNYKEFQLLLKRIEREGTSIFDGILES